MKIFEQLDNAYKKALQNFEPTPSEDQWQRLAVALKNEQKARRRKFIFLLSSFLLIVLTAAYLLLPGKNDNIVQIKNTGISVNEPAHQFSGEKSVFQQKNMMKREALSSQNANRQAIHNNIATPEPDVAAIKSNGNESIGNSNSTVLIDNPSITDKSDITETQANFNNGYAMYALGISAMNVVPELIPLPFEIDLPSSVVTQKSTNPNVSDRSGLFLTLSAGYGKTNNNILQVENAAKQHKDVNQIFTALNGNYNAKQIQAGVTYVPKKGPGVSFTGGIQYRALSHKYDLKYLYTDIPFKDVNGTILGYIKDTGSIMEFNLAGVNSLKFISLPVYFRAPLWFHKDNELFVGVGMQLQLTAGSRGYFFDLNTQETIKNMPSSFRKWNLGYTVGLGYSRRINRNTFFFTEIQGIGMPQIQKLDAGDFRSRMTGLNAQIGIKYKIK